ncbi:MAG: arginyltransferase, partial [Pseudomonadota bacterium]
PIRSRVIEYSSAVAGKPSLAAVCLTDVLDDGLSMVYSFYDPERIQNSLGTYVILDHIEIARDAGLPYVYLGYWVPGSPKMGYKARFPSLEVYFAGQWQDIGDASRYSSETHPLSTDPIAEQVARISLPDTRPTSA